MMQGHGSDAGLVLPMSVINSSSMLRDIRLTVTNPTLLYPFLLDQDTVSHIRRSKVMFLLRGLPGSGKSTLAKILSLKYRGSVICSADDYFLKNGVYTWCRKKLKDAHESCHQSAEQTCKNGKILIVDNSNIRAWEMDFYFRLAELHSYIVIIVETKTSWRHDITQLAFRTFHDVDSEELEHKLHSFELVIPIYYGWFLNETDSRELLRIAQAYLQKCATIKEFRKMLWSHAGRQMDVLKYYSNYTVGGASNILHCTACYCDRGGKDGTKDYDYQDCTRKYHGKAFLLNVIGFVLTPRTFGARVKLSAENLILWNMDDHERLVMSETRSGTAGRQADVQHLVSSVSSLHISSAGRSRPAQKTRAMQGIKTTCRWQASDIPAVQIYQPCKGRGSRAHITLGCSNDYEPVQTGFDQIEIVQLENRKGFQPRGAYVLDELAEACDYGNDRWVVYLSKQLTVMSVFTGCY